MQEIIEYTRLPSTSKALRFVVFYGNQELNVVIEEDSDKSLKDICREYLQLDDFELRERKKNE